MDRTGGRSARRAVSAARFVLPALVLTVACRRLSDRWYWRSRPSARTQDPPERPRRRTRGMADRYVDQVIDGEKVSCMYGNVFIDRDTLTVSCRHRLLLPGTGILRVHGQCAPDPSGRPC